jgi:hypothetical protein
VAVATVVINQGFTTRTRSSGREYTTIDVRSEALVHNLDAKQLGEPVALAIAQLLKDRILGIAARAAQSTLERRARAAKEPNDPSNLARYSGGRMGATAPAQSDRLFNDSGRLAKSIAARAAGDSFVVNVAANRLDRGTFGRGFDAMLQQLASYVPEIADPRRLLDSIPIRKALKDAQAGIIRKQAASLEALSDARARAIVGLGRQLLSLVA